MAAHRADAGASAAHWIGIVAAAAPCFYLSWVFFGVWAEPQSRDAGAWVAYAGGLVLVEFVLLHSGAFMAWPLQAQRLSSMHLFYFFALVVFYGVVAWVLAAWSGSPSLLTLYAGVVVGRSLVAFTDRQAGLKFMFARSLVGATLYLSILAAVIALPIPEWGITGAFLDAYAAHSEMRQLFGKAHAPVAWAAVYFLLIGLVELTLFGYAGDPARMASHRAA